MMIDVTFPGGLGVDAQVAGHTIHTDQRQRHGGGDTGPAPFDLFLASIATCMGFYALRFCQQRELSTEGLRLGLETERDPETRMIHTVRVQVELHEGFPPKYVRAIERSMDQCAVKKHMLQAPAFVMETEIAPSVPHLVS